MSVFPDGCLSEASYIREIENKTKVTQMSKQAPVKETIESMTIKMIKDKLKRELAEKNPLWSIPQN